MYVKLFASIYQGTLRGNAHGLLVFTNLLAHADEFGVADIHPKAIAEEVGISLEEANTALLMLESPDLESRTPDDEGRRISRIDEHRSWGWEIVNYKKYAAIKKAEDRREQTREAVKRHRERKLKENVSTCKQVKSSVSIGKPKKAKKAHTDIDTDTDTGGAAQERPIGSPPVTREEKARDLATEYQFYCRGGRGPLLDELAYQFGEKLRVYGDDRYEFILEKIKSDRDKTLPIFRFWKLCGMDEDIPDTPTYTPPKKSAEQIKFDADCEEVARLKREKANAAN